jgi:hypothetical protein
VSAAIDLSSGVIRPRMARRQRLARCAATGRRRLTKSDAPDPAGHRPIGVTGAVVFSQLFERELDWRANRLILLRCEIYSETRNQDAIRTLFRVAHDPAGNLPSLPGIFPEQLSPMCVMGSRSVTVRRLR